jgi:hypothetical protein
MAVSVRSTHVVHIRGHWPVVEGQGHDLPGRLDAIDDPSEQLHRSGASELAGADERGDDNDERGEREPQPPGAASLR